MMRMAVILTKLLCLLLILVAGIAADAVSGGPEAFLPESVFEFRPVVEGTRVEHAFVVQNHGDEPLVILDLKSG